MAFDHLLNFGRLPIGIDIGASGVRMVQMRRRGSEFALVSAARIDLPTSDHELNSEEYAGRLAAAIWRRVETGGFRGRECVLSPDDRWLRVRSVRHPPMGDAEMDRAVRIDAPGRLGYTDDELAQYGWVRAGEVRQGDESREEVVVVGADRSRLEQLVFALVKVGLRPEAVEPGFMGVARCFGRSLRRAADQSVTRVIVDIGERLTGVMVTRGQGVAFYKPLELGGEAMTRAASQRLGLDLDAVRDLRRQRAAAWARGATPSDARVDRAIYEAVRPLMDELARETAMCLRYYGVTFRGSRPEACLVVGGEAEEPQLTKLLGEELHLPTSVGRPLDGITAPADSAHGGGGGGALARPQWAAATGLGLRNWQLKQEKVARRRRTDPDAAPARSGALEARTAA